MAGARKPTPLEAEQIAKGLLDPSILLPKPSAATQPAGRLAPRRPTDAPPAQTRQPDAVRPDAKSQPSNAAILEAITKLTLAFEKLQATLAPRTDA
jgi:hypothetical protein